jgi:hypothetical protein
MVRNWFWSLTLSALTATTSTLADEPTKARSEPAGAAVEARLSADRDSYTLDLNGLSAEDYKKQLKGSEKGGPNPPIPKVNLTLELVNTSGKEVQLRYGGTMNVYTLELKGPGAETVAFGGRAEPKFILAPKTVTLAPGQSVKVKIDSLAFGRRNLTHAAFWTAPGDYTLAISYQAMLNPAPEGAKDAGNGFGNVTLTSAPIKLKVTEK